MTRKLSRRDHIDDIFDQMQKMFSQFQETGRELGQEFNLMTNVPVDITEEDGKVVVTADLPGVTKEDINLKANDEGLEISAESSQEVKEENEKYIRRERSSRSFRRKLHWPSRVDPESVTAEYEDGVLTVEAEKEEDGDSWNVEIE